MIYCYTRASGNKHRDARKELREDILGIANDVGIDSIGLKNKVIFQLIRYFPVSVTVLSLLYSFGLNVYRHILLNIL